ncbi:hypothetical protein RJ640_025741 [Escallonia rubra]|uniref:Probable glutathione S-transferase n=1 Tax=Escallonia rubra TaxID=112253 RepID=A0AA88RY37_9ASTE|nr:hypothetical protein RJ640_025741 [Escallonia rubra]
MADEVKLFRTWSSPYALRIVWALKLKGIEFETIFEDLASKSASLLQYNPVYKKVPVLVHNGKSVCESLVIIEYIDETWKQNPLLPEDPYGKAMARFWAKFNDDKVLPSVWHVFISQGKEQEEAMVPAIENLKFLEQQLKGQKFFGGDTIGHLDLAVGWMANLVSIFEAVTGLKLIVEEKLPHLSTWMQDFSDVPLKGIEFETIFEDLASKSASLLQYNPVYKKVPVLVHNGKSVCESLVIIEYIDETWKQNPLLPEDPYGKAMARFWAKFNDDKVLPSVWHVFISQGKEQEEAMVPAIENLKFLEQQLKGQKFFGGDTIGLLDLAVGWMANLVSIFEAVTGLKLIVEEKLPHLSTWMQDFSDVPVIKENWPPRERMITKYQIMLEPYLAAAANKHIKNLELGSHPRPENLSDLSYASHNNMAEEVKLFRTWTSPFALRIVWALKLKGIEFDTIFEDFPNKSALLLEYNPVHKKVPVLVHNGNSICESLVIIEYIEEAWKENPLLPEDPYEKAMARFWAKVSDDKVLPSVWHAYFKQGKEQEEATATAMENLKLLEEQLKGKKFFGGETIGYLDLAVGWMANLVSILEEVVGLKVIDEEKNPLLSTWMQDFSDVPVIKENWPPREKLITKFHVMRETYLAAAAKKLVN